MQRQKKLTATGFQQVYDQIESEGTSYTDDDDYGIDSHVMEMKLDDGYMESDQQAGQDVPEYTTQYLLRCREQLMSKVSHYRKLLEEQEVIKKKMALENSQKIQNIRTFYQNIAYAPTRSGKLVRAALSKTPTAKEFLKEVTEDSS